MSLTENPVQSRGGGGISPPNTGVTPDVLPEVQNSPWEENSQTGVSTRNAVFGTNSSKDPKSKSKDDPHWFTLRCTYGREKKAFEFLCSNNIKTFYPTITHSKTIGGETEQTTESRIPNILFAFGTFDQLKVFVYDNQHEETKYLRFYYNRHHDGTKEPLIIPQWQMDSLMKICDAEAEDKYLEPFVVEKFRMGQMVRVKDGPFAGVEGIVKRYKGQQRIGIVVENLFTITTTYISKDKLEVIDTTEI